MPRIRSIHPDACKSEKLAAAGPGTERFYWRVQTHCDDEGRCEDNPRLIWAAVFPLVEDEDPSTVERWLCRLHDVGLVIRYEIDGRRFLQVTQWGVYQHPQRRQESKFPPPPGWVIDESARGTRRVRAGGGGEKENGEGGGGTRIPDTFTITEEMAVWAKEHTPDVDVSLHTRRFVNHFKATTRNALKKDWTRTWQNWLLKEQDSVPPWVKKQGQVKR